MKTGSMALLAALVLCGTARAEGSATDDGQALVSAEQLRQLKMAVVQRQPISDVLRMGGRVAFDDLKVSHVFSPVGGRVTRVLASPGQRVKKGAPLAVLASPDVGSAFSDLLKAQADLDAAEHELTRQRELFEAHAGPQRDYEAAEDNERKAKAEYGRARQRTRFLDAASADGVRQEYTLRAPIDGEVVARNVNPGVEVQGQYGGGSAQELFTVGELDPVYVYADLHEQELGQVQLGQAVQVSVVAYPNRVFEGKVDFISSTLDPTLRTAQVRCRIPNPDRLLKPEMYATVVVPLQRPPELAVPRSAVIHLGEHTVVFVSTGQTPDGRTRFERRPVHVDEDVTGDYYPVQDGLREGDAVVTDGALLLTQASGA